MVMKPVAHNNINFFYMMVSRGNRVKYNSWYTKLNPLSSMAAGQAQPTEKRSEVYANTETVERREQDDDSDTEAVRVEDLKDDPVENVLDEETPV